MGSLKTLAYVGAVAMVAASAVATASAADLSPPPAPLMAPPPAPMIETASGIYLRGDVGVGHMGESSVSSAFNNAAVVAPNWNRDKMNFDGVAFGGVGVGYQFNSFFRADITGEYRTPSRYESNYSYLDAVTCPNTIGTRCHDTYKASIRSMVFLANGYVDLGTWRGITPYVGAGVGVANHKVSGMTDIGYPTLGYGFAPDKSANKLAWALMAGLGFDVTRNLKMEVGYRYLNMGTMTSGVIACDSTLFPCADEVHKFKLQSHDVKVGFRYLLNDDLPSAAAAPVMYAAPAMAPVARRY